MIRFIYIFLALILPFNVYAQGASSAWIDYSKKHVKVRVVQNGVYRITYNELNTAISATGESLSTIPSNSFKLYYLGNEIPLWVWDGSDGLLEMGDQLVFAFKNQNAQWDSLLYSNPKQHTNPFVPLFSDTASLYLTWNHGNARNFQLKTSQQASTHNKLSSVIREQHVIFSNRYYRGSFQNQTWDPSWTYGEGFMRNSISLSQTATINIPIADKVVSNIQISATAFGTDNYPSTGNNHKASLYSNNSLLQSAEFSEYNAEFLQGSVPKTSISNGVIQCKLSSETPSGNPSQSSISTPFVSASYNASPDSITSTFWDFEVLANTDSTYIEIKQFPGTHPILFDTENRTITIPNIQSNSDLITVPPGKHRPLLISDSASIMSVLSVNPVALSNSTAGTFKNYVQSGVGELAIVTTNKLASAANTYAAYRQSKGISSSVILIEDLYEQYAHGMLKNPLAIRLFVNDLLENSPNPPSHLLLIGKAVEYPFTINNSTNANANELPSWGSPATDILLTAGLKNLPAHETPVAVGRIVARTPTDVIHYLDKVKAYEAATQTQSISANDALWKKRYLYSEGAGEVNLQRLLLSYYDEYSKILGDSAAGFYSHLFLKNTSSVIDPNVSDSLVDFLSSGTAVMHFYGHGSAANLGVNIGTPSDYKTGGKFPLFVASSCNVGNIHLEYIPSLSLNEEWVLTPDAGAIAFLASTTQGFVSPLHLYNRAFYTAVSKTHYGKTIGEQMQAASASLSQSIGPLLQWTIQEMNLHGDPMITLPQPDKSDLALYENHAQTTPEKLSTELTSFQLDVKAFNLGKAVTDSVEIRIIQTFNDGSDTTHFVWLQGLFAVDSFQIEIPIDPIKSIGETELRIQIDPENVIEESDEITNQQIQLKINVSSDALIPIYPAPFAMISHKNPTLAASTADPFAPLTSYEFQIDTTDGFNSPLMKSQIVSSAGGVVQWTPNLSHWPDSIVYYWRTSPATGSERKWLLESFEFIPNQSGWSQSHFYQYDRNQLLGMAMNRNQRSFEVGIQTAQLFAQTKGNPSLAGGAFENELNSWALNGEVVGRQGFCGNRPSLLVSIINPRNLEVWSTRYDREGNLVEPNNYFGNYNDPLKSSCPRGDYRFMYLIDSTYFESMKQLIQQVPDSFYILIVGANQLQLNKQNPSGSKVWNSTQMFTFLENLGADSVRHTGADFPWLFFTQKGNPSKAVEVLAKSNQDLLRLSASFPSIFDNAQMTSPIVGPAKNWGSFVWEDRVRSPLFTGDSSYVTIYGLSPDRNETFLGTFPIQQSILPNISSVIPSVNNYPYLKFRYTSINTSNSIPQRRLHRWHITYERQPELAISPNLGYAFHSDSLYQGEDISLRVPVINLGSAAAPNHYMQYKLQKKGTNAISTYTSQKPLNSGATYEDNTSIQTDRLFGQYAVSIEVNPDDTTGHFYEAHTFNNLVQESTQITKDNINPLLNVTFDGRRIMDGDIVSSKPVIVMEASDDNPYLKMNDTSAFEVYLAKVSAEGSVEDYQRIAMGTNRIYNTPYTLTFSAAEGDKNDAKLTFEPQFSTDGIYKLKVQSRDVTGNLSGATPYEISFEVIQKSSITHILNYPNPFSTATQFVFTITGDRVPDYLTIQILTISGKVVKTIRKEELGPLYVGTNRTAYRWDGTDEYGDRLANGVYLYKVSSGLVTKELEHRETEADQYFRKGYGKMYLVR